MAKSKKKSTKSKKKGTAKSSKGGARALPKSLRKGLPRPIAEVLAAGLGALDRAQASGSDEFLRLVDRGRTVEQRGSDAVRSAVARVGAVVDDTVGAAQARREAVQSRVEAAVEAAVGALGLPTGGDVAALRAELVRLEARAAGAEAGAEAGAAVPRFRVAPHADGWALERAGAPQALAVHATKKAALVAARAHARAHAPSALEVLRADGSLADTTRYDA